MLRTLTAIFFIAAGLNHFRRPEMYQRIMPPMFPHPAELVCISGAFEIIGGIGLLIPRLRRRAAWGLILLLLAIFPANIFMAVESNRFAVFPKWMLWARLPLQPILMVWVSWVGRDSRSVE